MDPTNNNIIKVVSNDSNEVFKPLKVELNNDIVFRGDVSHPVDLKVHLKDLGDKYYIDQFDDDEDSMDTDNVNYYKGNGVRIDLSNVQNRKCGEEVTEDSLYAGYDSDDLNELSNQIPGNYTEEQKKSLIYRNQLTSPNPNLSVDQMNQFNYIYKIPYRLPRSGQRNIYEVNIPAKQLNFNGRSVKNWCVFDSLRKGENDEEYSNFFPNDTSVDYLTDNVNIWLDIPNYIGMVEIRDNNSGVYLQEDEELGTAMIDFRSLTLNAPLTFLGNASGYDCYYVLYNIKDRSIYIEVMRGNKKPGEIKSIEPSYLLYRSRCDPAKLVLNNDATDNDLFNALLNKEQDLEIDGEISNGHVGLNFDIYFQDTYDRFLYRANYDIFTKYEGGENPKCKMAVAPQYLDQMTDTIFKDNVRQNEHMATVVELTTGVLDTSEVDDDHPNNYYYESDDERNEDINHKVNKLKGFSRYVDNSFVIRNNGIYPDVVGAVQNDMKYAPLVNKDYFKANNEEVRLKNDFAKDCIAIEKGHLYCIVLYTKQITVDNKYEITKRFSAVLLSLDPQLEINILYITKSPNIDVIYCEDITDKASQYLNSVGQDEPAYISVDVTLLGQNNKIIDLQDLNCKSVPKYEKPGEDVTVPGSVVNIGYDTNTFESKARFLIDLSKRRIDLRNGAPEVFNSTGIFVIDNIFVEGFIPKDQLTGKRDFGEVQKMFKRYFDDDEHDDFVVMNINEDFIEMIGSQFYINSFDSFYSSLDNRIRQLVVMNEQPTVNIFNVDESDTGTVVGPTSVSDRKIKSTSKSVIDKKIKNKSRKVKKGGKIKRVVDLKNFKVTYVREKSEEKSRVLDDELDFDGDLDDFYDHYVDDDLDGLYELYAQEKTLNSGEFGASEQCPGYLTQKVRTLEFKITANQFTD